MSERRSRQRHHIEPIEISSPTLSGQVLNMSMDGLAIETATAIRPGKTIRLKIDGEGSVVTGSVRWARLKSVRSRGDGNTEAVYHAGIRIERDDEPPAPEEIAAEPPSEPES